MTLSRLKPTGNEPTTAKVGAGEPEAVTWNEYGAAAVPFVGAPEVITAATGVEDAPVEDGSMVTVYRAVAGVPTPLSAVTVNSKIPPVVGVPVISPLVASRVRPSGKAPCVTVNWGAGLPLAVTVNTG